MSETRIDGNVFFKRLEKVYKVWENPVNLLLTKNYRPHLFISVTVFSS